MADYFLINVDRGSEQQLNAVHEAVSKAANGYWHWHTNIWIAGGKTAAQWRDLLAPLLEEGDAALLVLKLPPKESRAWAYLGRNLKKRTAWLDRNYID